MQDSNQYGEKPPVDNQFKPSDNNDQDGLTEIIDRRQLVPLNDVECTHETYVVDHSDETDSYVAMVCSNSQCPVGYLQSK